VHDDGSLTDRRRWAKLDGAVPDGICLDAEGAIWSACPLTGRVLRVREGGEVTDVVGVTRRGAYACMLGGPDRRTLLVCVADASNPDETGNRRGAIEVCEVDVPGAGRP
jgi:sugar lactone lactonase YvrE